MIDGIWKLDMVDYSDEDEALREAKRVCVQYIKLLDTASEAARKRIRTQKNPPPENSPQWEILFQKYLDEEANKKGG
jgi:hypothetical protein